MLPTSAIAAFQDDLLTWYGQQKRDLPWRLSRDPYRIWISEVMLQQTRVTAVLPYYERFLRRFPDVASLAEAPESDLLTNWAGLGYYHRARNLREGARQIVAAGRFPDTFDGIRALPGVGDYTAAAIASIAFNLLHVVVDGNVYRVASRLFADSTDIAGSGARAYFAAKMQTLLPPQRPGDFNQAVMELGATICLPKNPKCLLCPVRVHCAAGLAGNADQFPVKTRRQRNSAKIRRLFWIERAGAVLLWQRTPELSLMPGFWELPEEQHLSGVKLERQVGSFRHSITVNDYVFEVWLASINGVERQDKCVGVPLADLETLPTSTVVRKASRLMVKARASAAAG